MNGILDLGGHSIEAVTVPVNVDDAVTTKKYCNDNFAALSGFTMSGDINMYDNKIIGLLDPTSESEPVTKWYADDKFADKDGFAVQRGIDMTGYTITNHPNPLTDTEPVTKSYADSRYVRKTKLTSFEWLSDYANVKAFRFPSYKSLWPASVRTDEITDNTNIELRHISRNCDVTIAFPAF